MIRLRMKNASFFAFFVFLQLPEYTQTKCWHRLVGYILPRVGKKKKPSIHHKKTERTLPSRSALVICTIDFDYQQKTRFYMQKYTRVSAYFSRFLLTSLIDSTSKNIKITLWTVERISRVGSIWLSDKDI